MIRQMASLQKRIEIALQHTMRASAGTLLISIAYILIEKKFLAGIGLGTVTLFGSFTLFIVFGPYTLPKRRKRKGLYKFKGLVAKQIASLQKRIEIALQHTMRASAGALLMSIAYIFIEKKFLAGIGLGTVTLFGSFTLFTVFGPYTLPKKRERKGLFSQQCDLETQASVGLYDDFDICGRKVNWGLRLEQKQKSQLYNIDSKLSSKIY